MRVVEYFLNTEKKHLLYHPVLKEISDYTFEWERISAFSIQVDMFMELHINVGKSRPPYKLIFFSPHLMHGVVSSVSCIQIVYLP